MKTSCLNCSKILLCRNPNKGPKYKCGDFKQTPLSNILGMLDMELEPEEGSSKSKRIIPIEREKDIILPPSEVDIFGDSDDATNSNEFYDAMRKSYDPLTNTVKDIRIDDTDFPLAKNVYHYVDKVLGKNTKLPFARQFWIMYHLTAEYCPRCTDKDMEQIDNVPVEADTHEIAERAALLINGICPKCNATKGEMVLSGELNDYNQLVAVLGQRSGKSMMSGLMSSYAVHRMLKLPKLSEITRGIQDFTPLTATFVALSFTRAEKLLWNPFNELVKGSDWFQGYHEMLNTSGKRYGMEFLKERKCYLYYQHKNIEVYPLGPMKRALRGDTRYLASLDELGWFKYDVKVEGEEDDDDEREVANADEVHAALENSLLTVRTELHNLYKKGIHHAPNAWLLATSSPASWRDKICRLLKESEGSKQSLGVRLSTWNVNPSYTEDHPFIAEQYRKNPQRAERDYGANPPKLASERYKPEHIQTLFTGVNRFKVEQVHTDKKLVYGRINAVGDSFGANSVGFRPTNRPTWEPTVLAIDAGFNNNSFAFALGSLQYSKPQTIWNKKDELSDQDAPTLKVKCIGEVIPRDGYEVSFPMMYTYLITRLIKECNTVYLVADRWNSLMLLQSVGAQFPEQCGGLQYSLRKEDFTSFDTDYINASKIQFPALELEPEVIESVSDYKKGLMGKPASHLYLQFRTVMEAKGVVMKGDGFTDDIYRSVVLLATAVRLPKVAKAIHEASKKVRRPSTHNQVVISGRSLGSAIRE